MYISGNNSSEEIGFAVGYQFQIGNGSHRAAHAGSDAAIRQLFGGERRDKRVSHIGNAAADIFDGEIVGQRARAYQLNAIIENEYLPWLGSAT